eukprot:jgi/Tetstr1/445862/TSEL_033502.t1
MQRKAGYWLRNCLPSEVEAFAEAVDATVLAAIERVLGVSFDPSTYGTDTNPAVLGSVLGRGSFNATSSARRYDHFLNNARGSGSYAAAMREAWGRLQAATACHLNDAYARGTDLVHLDAASGMWTIAIPTARTVMTPHELREVAAGTVPLSNTVPRDELKDLVPDAELSLPAFNVVTGSYDPRSLKSTLLEFKTMRYGVKYTDAVPRATVVDRFERSLLGDIQRGLAARDAAWHNTEPGQMGPLRDNLDMSEYTGMVFGTVEAGASHKSRRWSNFLVGSTSLRTSSTTASRDDDDAPCAVSSSSEPGSSSAALSRDGAATERARTHLVVLVNGVRGHPSDWAQLLEGARGAAGLAHVTFHASRVNARRDTFEGIDVCGGRLAREVTDIVTGASSPHRYTEISFIGHSMGGLVARHAIGTLFDPRGALLLGLRPKHFITLATPHLGFDLECGSGVAQVPVVGWAGHVPLIGGSLQRALSRAAPPLVASLLGRSGEQLFHRDADGPGGVPLLVRLASDCAGEAPFFTALAAFRTHTLYANVAGDQSVGWANSSLRFKDELPDVQRSALISESPSTPDLRTGPGAARPPSQPEGAAASLCQPAQPRMACAGSHGAGERGNTYVNPEVTAMLLRLQTIPWHRVDVCYHERWIHLMAHNHIQVTRKWLNSTGLPTLTHLLELLVKLEHGGAPEGVPAPAPAPVDPWCPGGSSNARTGPATAAPS